VVKVIGSRGRGIEIDIQARAMDDLQCYEYSNTIKDKPAVGKLLRQETADPTYKKIIAKYIKLFSKTENDKHSIRRMYARDSREGMNNKKTPNSP
jgi:hypothetical protein